MISSKISINLMYILVVKLSELCLENFKCNFNYFIIKEGFVEVKAI